MKRFRKCSTSIVVIVTVKLTNIVYFYRLVARSFDIKGDITKYFKTTNRFNELVELQQKSWQAYVDETHSFVVKDKSNRIVGVCINKEYHFDPYEAYEIPQSQGLSANISALSNFLFAKVM